MECVRDKGNPRKDKGPSLGGGGKAAKETDLMDML